MALHESTALEVIAAERHLTEDEAQIAGPLVGRALLGLLPDPGGKGQYARYSIDRSDKSGATMVDIAQADVGWAFWRHYGFDGKHPRLDYQALSIFGHDAFGEPTTTGEMISVVALDQATYRKLFAVCLPLDAECAGLYRFAEPTRRGTYNPSGDDYVMESDSMNYPQRVSVAAMLFTHIMRAGLPAVEQIPPVAKAVLEPVGRRRPRLAELGKTLSTGDVAAITGQSRAIPVSTSTEPVRWTTNVVPDLGAWHDLVKPMDTEVTD